jgi:hypothetical protein
MVKKIALLLVVFFCTAAFAEGLPRIAVYVTGDVPENVKKALSTRMLSAFINLGRYDGIERSNAFLAEIEKEQIRQRSGAIDDSQISELGKQFGVKFICIADITPLFDAYQISARIVDVETARILHIGEAYSPLQTVDDFRSASHEVVRVMLRAREHTAPRRREPESVPAPAVAAPVPAARESRSAPAPSAPPPRPTDNVVADGRKKAEPKPAAAPKAKPEPKPKVKPEPKPRSMPEIEMSAGGGVFFSNDAGGGITWNRTGGQVSMPYMGGGAYLFFDAAYAQVFAAYSAGGGKWESANATDPGDLPDVSRVSFNVGVFLKYPVTAGLPRNMTLFPLAGIDYAASLSGKFKYVDGREYTFDGEDTRPDAGGLSALWFKFGGGLDVGLTENLYLRTELLYGVRTANPFEKDGVENSGSPATTETRRGHGLTMRVGVGVKI